jgi:hypothetical protein
MLAGRTVLLPVAAFGNATNDWLEPLTDQKLPSIEVLCIGGRLGTQNEKELREAIGSFCQHRANHNSR